MDNTYKLKKFVGIMLFIHLAQLFEKLEHTSSSNQMQQLLAGFFKTADDVDKICYLTLGTIASPYDDVNLGMAEQMVIKSIAEAFGVAERNVTTDFKKLGDLGAVAEKECSVKKQTITVHGVFSSLHNIASAQGAGSQNRKVMLLAALLKKATPVESKFIVRIALGTLRMGVGEMTLLNALAIAFTHDKKNKEILEQAYNVCPDVGIIAATLVKGLSSIKKIQPVVGRPIKVMLAQRAKSVAEIMKRMPLAAAEEKYDGERVQIHKKGKKIWLFSRRMETITQQYPDIAAAVQKLHGNFIIEGEIVAVDARGMHDFQTLMQRRRKHDVEHFVKHVPVAVFLFDLLFKERSYLAEPWNKRQDALKHLIGKETPIFKYAKYILTERIDDVEQFFSECLERGTEGIIAKSVDGVYQAGTRGYNWIKWKPEYAKNLRDTFDLVVVGGFSGKGKRAGTYGALLCACYNPIGDRFETFCKLGSGFKDKELDELPLLLKKYVVRKPARVIVHKNMKPDVWFDPRIVVEVTGAEITRSSLHTAAENDGVGLALRFPRFLRYRTDKKAEQATTTKEIKKMA